MLPEWASVTIDRRLLPGELAEGVVARIGLIAESHGGTGTKVNVLRRMHPYSAPAASEATDLFEAVATEVLGHVPGKAATKSGCSAGFLMTEAAVPSVVLGPGRLSDMGPAEHVSIDRLKEALRIYRRFALRYLAVG
jgi:acetylornithine deacetylase/succinyl-diaminopimelate desuccinylase-like protein